MQALYEIFSKMQDDVYFPGYCLAMESTNPEKLNFEWEQFLKMFSK